MTWQPKISSRPRPRQRGPYIGADHDMFRVFSAIGYLRLMDAVLELKDVSGGYGNSRWRRIGDNGLRNARRCHANKMLRDAEMP